MMPRRWCSALPNRISETRGVVYLDPTTPQLHLIPPLFHFSKNKTQKRQFEKFNLLTFWLEGHFINFAKFGPNLEHFCQATLGTFLISCLHPNDCVESLYFVQKLHSSFILFEIQFRGF